MLGQSPFVSSFGIGVFSSSSSSFFYFFFFGFFVCTKCISSTHIDIKPTENAKI